MCDVCVCLSIMNDLMVALSGGPPPIRLVDGTSSYEGRVEIFVEVMMMLM